MQFAILSAMQEEISGTPLQGKLIKKETFSGKTFYLWKTQEFEIIIVVTSVGKVAAAQAITALLTRYNPRHIIIVGTAGAMDASLNIGDIVISSQLYQHDVDLRPFRPRFELGISGKTFFEADSNLIQLANNASELFIQSKKSNLQKENLRAFNITSPKILTGVMTSGDMFFSSEHNNYKVLLKKTMPETLTVDMEGAAIAQVCSDLNFPFVAIRFISDRADAKACIDHNAFIEKISAWYAQEIIQNMLVYYK